MANKNNSKNSKQVKKTSKTSKPKSTKSSGKTVEKQSSKAPPAPVVSEPETSLQPEATNDEPTVSPTEDIMARFNELSQSLLS